MHAATKQIHVIPSFHYDVAYLQSYSEYLPRCFAIIDAGLRLLEEHPTLRFVDDQVGHPTFTADLAPVVARLALERRPGVFHVTNQGAVSWWEFARAVAGAAGADPDRVEPISTAEMTPPRPAPRPANSRLENRALELYGIDRLRDFREPLAELVAALT